MRICRMAFLSDYQNLVINILMDLVSAVRHGFFVYGIADQIHSGQYYQKYRQSCHLFSFPKIPYINKHSVFCCSNNSMVC